MCHSCLIVRSVACLGCSKAAPCRPTFEADCSKARQWGGSTLCRCIVVCGFTVHSAATGTRSSAPMSVHRRIHQGMHTKMLACYPQDYWVEESPPRSGLYERSINTRVISGRIAVSPVGRAARTRRPCAGSDLRDDHLSEVASPDTAMRSPEGVHPCRGGGYQRGSAHPHRTESTANSGGHYFTPSVSLGAARATRPP